MRHFVVLGLSALLTLALSACNTGAGTTSVAPEPAAEKAATPSPAPAAPAPSPTAAGALRFGSAIDATTEKAALTDVAKNPGAFAGKTFATTGTVTAVCQHRGCWMEIKDESGEAHIKMAGHGFFVPRSASGRKARVLATLVEGQNDNGCGEASHDKNHGAKGGCRAEAETQLGRPLAKLELVAKGVELM